MPSTGSAPTPAAVWRLATDPATREYLQAHRACREHGPQSTCTVLLLREGRFLEVDWSDPLLGRLPAAQPYLAARGHRARHGGRLLGLEPVLPPSSAGA
jgi:hypothetical protein